MSNPNHYEDFGDGPLPDWYDQCSCCGQRANFKHVALNGQAVFVIVCQHCDR